MMKMTRHDKNETYFVTGEVVLLASRPSCSFSHSWASRMPFVAVALSPVMACCDSIKSVCNDLSLNCSCSAALSIEDSLLVLTVSLLLERLAVRE